MTAPLAKNARRRAGSHSTLAPQDAKVCCVCGGKLRVTRDPAIRYATSLGIGWHTYRPDCDTEGWTRYAAAVRAAGRV